MRRRRLSIKKWEVIYLIIGQMNLMVGNIANVLDLIWTWISPLDDESLSR